MPMTTAQGTTAINTTLAAELAEFAQLRANQTQLSQEDTFQVNVDLATKLRAALVTALDDAWSD